MTTPLERQLAEREQKRKCQAEDDYWQLVEAAASSPKTDALSAQQIDVLAEVLRVTGRTSREFDAHVALSRERAALQSSARTATRERATRELAQAQAAFRAKREAIEQKCAKLRSELDPLQDQLDAAERAARAALNETNRIRSLEVELRRDRRPRGELLLGAAGFARAVSERVDAGRYIGELEQEIGVLSAARDRLVTATAGLKGIERDRSEDVAELRRIEARIDAARAKIGEQTRRLRAVEQELGIAQVTS